MRGKKMIFFGVPYEMTIPFFFVKIFDLQTKRALVLFEEKSRTVLFPSSYIVEPIRAQFFQVFTVGESVTKGVFSPSNNKIAFLSETASWTKKQTLIVIEMDKNLQTVKVRYCRIYFTF